MTRKEFLRVASILGVGFPMQTVLSSCTQDENVLPSFEGKVIIIGAGAGGLSAGYLLQQQGIDFEILEASGTYGGRMKTDNQFADFPIPLGAEWLETEATVLQEIVNDTTVDVRIDTIEDSHDRKFVNSSWFDFYTTYILPSVAEKITYNQVVQAVEYSSDQVVVTTQNSEFRADKVIVATPLKILQVEDIRFSPTLPPSKLDAINDTTVWDGFKAFFEFDTKFYDEEYEFDVTPSTDGHKLYYNAAFGQATSKNILGFFVVGGPARPYLARTGNELRDYILSELDGLYENQATPTYISHVVQNWNNEPFIKGGYLSDHADENAVRTLRQSVDGKVYFVGAEFTEGADWVSVQNAAESAKLAVTELVA